MKFYTRFCELLFDGIVLGYGSLGVWGYGSKGVREFGGMGEDYRHTPTSPYSWTARNCTCILKIWMLCLVVVGLGMQTSYAQAVHPGVELTRPNRSTANLSDRLHSQKIGLFLSGRTIDLNPEYDETLRESVRQWEHFLIGHGLSYRILEDTSLMRPLPASMPLVVLPSAEVLSAEQQETLKQHLRRGGGVIASGRTGYFDDKGVWQNDRFFREVFSAEPSIDLPDTLRGLIQSLAGGNAVTEGLPAGFEMNVSRPDYGFAAIPIESQAIGHANPYRRMDVSLIEQAINASTLLLSGSYEGGRFVWIGFGPQDVSRAERQQAVYQSLILNAIAYTTRTPSISIRKWPQGLKSASAFVMLPSAAYRPYSYRTSLELVLSALERSKVPATGFFVTERASDHPDLLKRFKSVGELALTGNSVELLDGLPDSLQINRLKTASLAINMAGGGDVAGLYPPGGFYDSGTLRAALDVGMKYVLLNDRPSISPAWMPWEDELDYRDSLLSRVGHDPASSSKEDSTAQHTANLLAFYPTLYSYELSNAHQVEGMEQGEAWYDMLERSFIRAHSAHGLFLFAFDAESIGLSTQRVGALDNIARFVKTQNSWVTSLQDIQRWWVARENVKVSLKEDPGNRFEIVVENQGEAPIEGVSINFWFDTLLQDELEIDTPELDVTSTTDKDKLILVIRSLPPGEHTIRLVPSEGS